MAQEASLGICALSEFFLIISAIQCEQRIEFSKNSSEAKLFSLRVNVP